MKILKKEIRIAFSDFPGETNTDFLLSILSQRWEIIIDENKPDYVIYSVFGNDFLKFKNAVRICFIGENVRPDFNLCDYAFSYDWLDFSDRHFRAPNFMLYPQWQDLLDREASTIVNLNSKPDFCNFIYTNGNGHPNRVNFFDTLNKVKKVESFGKFLTNSDRSIDAPYINDWSQSKVESQRSFRFSIAFENSGTPGYTTEKIVHALSADTIPIYWGDPQIGRVFNSERFIDVRALGFEKSIQKIIQLENDESAFLEILKKPFFSKQAPTKNLTLDALLNAFSHIFDQSPKDALRRDLFLWGPIYEENRRREIRAYRVINQVKKYPRKFIKYLHLLKRYLHLGVR